MGRSLGFVSLLAAIAIGAYVLALASRSVSDCAEAAPRHHVAPGDARHPRAC